MIEPEDRFWITFEAVFPDFPDDQHTTNIIDWDQRRWYTIKGSTKFLPPEEGREIDVLKRYIDLLAQNVHSITVDDEGLLVAVSSNPEDDETQVIHYPRYSEVPSLQDCPTIRLSQLTELDRLGPEVDLMSYVDSSGVHRKVVFKYNIIVQWIKHIWKEIHLTKGIPKHPHIVPFDHVVVEDDESRIIGFTTHYIPGGTFDANRNRVFQLLWLQQLTAVVDYLNLELGIIHQDIAPRNLVIDPNTNNIQLFDFDRAARVGERDCIPELNDVKGVIFTLYEIITHDDDFRRVPFYEQDPQAVLDKEWTLKTHLDSDISHFRKHLDDWVQRRREISDITHSQPKFSLDIAVPELNPPTPIITSHDEGGEPIYESSSVQRRFEAVNLKQNVVYWERPPYDKAYPKQRN